MFNFSWRNSRQVPAARPAGLPVISRLATPICGRRTANWGLDRSRGLTPPPGHSDRFPSPRTDFDACLPRPDAANPNPFQGTHIRRSSSASSNSRPRSTNVRATGRASAKGGLLSLFSSLVSHGRLGRPARRPRVPQPEPHGHASNVRQPAVIRRDPWGRNRDAPVVLRAANRDQSGASSGSHRTTRE
jgi:hypothetical protein